MSNKVSKEVAAVLESLEAEADRHEAEGRHAEAAALRDAVTRINGEDGD